MLLFHEINQSGVVFAHERLLVLAGDIVPFHAVAVEVVHDGEARLVILALMDVGKEGMIKIRIDEWARRTMQKCFTTVMRVVKSHPLLKERNGRKKENRLKVDRHGEL